MKPIITIAIFSFSAITYCFGQSTYLNRTSPSSASAQLFFYDRSSNNVTERNWKIATLPASTNGTGDKIQIEIFGGQYVGGLSFQQVIHMGNRNGFEGYLRTEYGYAFSSVRIRAYSQTNGSVDVYFSLFPNSWKGACVQVFDGSGISSPGPIIYENPVDVGPTPTGSLVFDSYDETASLSINNADEVLVKEKLGVGTNSPSHPIHIKTPSGNDQTARIYLQGTGQNNAGTANNIELSGAMISGTADDASFGRYNVGIESWYGIGFKSTYNNKEGIIFNTRNGSAFFDGKVGIGTDSPDSKLAVNGTIHTKEVKVDLDGWPDFVFEEDYELRSLKEVENYIAENKHLPQIPSENEVIENGINLGEMDAMLLQKIEELTLYLIEMNKEIQNLKQENSELRMSISTNKD